MHNENQVPAGGVVNGQNKPAQLSPNVVKLGWVSLLTDISSEMLYPVVPIFLTTVLGAPMAALGLIEGLAESAANILKIFSGWWSDNAGKRRPFVIGGYGLSAFSKPLLAFSQFLGWPFVLLMRVADRTGKGLRTSARDALIADYTPESQRGRAYGLHRAMDSMGAVLGPLAALFFISRISGGDRAAQLLGYRQIFLWAFVPAILGVLVLFLVQEKPFSPRYQRPRFGWKTFNRDFKVFVLVNLVFALGNSSDAFLIVKADKLFSSGPHAIATVILVYVLYNLTYALGSYPAGVLADKFGARRVFVTGLLLFSLVYAGFAFNRSPALIWVLFAVYGFYTAFTDGVGKAYASKLVQPEFRATGMGVYHMSNGLATFAASTAGGLLWNAGGGDGRFTFLYGSVMALLAAALFVVLVKRKA